MKPIKKKVVHDELNRPVAVQIDYADWLEIERALALAPNGVRNGSAPSPFPNLDRFAGRIRLPEDPTAYQDRVRGEWSGGGE